MGAPQQLGFDALLADAKAENRQRRFARETAHMPETMAAALPFYRDLLARHHAAMLAGDAPLVADLREEAHTLAELLNGGDPGILAHPDAPGYVLAEQTAAPDGQIPLWGQQGRFTVTIDRMAVRVAMEGLFSVCSHAHWLGFQARAVDPAQPFLSETGFRSFLGIYAEPVQGLTTSAFVEKVLRAYVQKDLKGRLRRIKPAA